ncbi:MAG TPA: M81 family metallopeptidase [Bryobacteraceae bacterium]|nr:M81 family metallopeptidase [Bryobacteraceae bacterium]
MRVGIAGLLHESNTFLPRPTVYEDFASTSLTRGAALMERWRGAKHELGGFIEGAREFGWTAAPALAAFAVPSGALTEEAFERLTGELAEAIQSAGPVDGMLLGLHGATVATGFPDADGEILRRVRALLGPEAPIVTTLDLHANISPAMAAHSTAIVAYRSNPHLDQWERGLEAAALLDRILKQAVRPTQALECPPMLIRISSQHTAGQPAQAIYDDVREALTWPGILTASAAMGFYYADVEEMGASFLAVADGDAALARRAARWLAKRAWDRRREFAASLPQPADAVRYAAQSARTPVVLMDVGDNVGGGSPGDSRVLFDEALRQGVDNALVILHDPAGVQECVRAGVRSAVRIGGLTGTVRTLSDGMYVETQVRHGGWTQNDQGVTAVVETPQRHTIVLTSRRMAPMSLEQILSLGIHPERKRILIVKGVVAPRAAYEPVAGEIVLVDTPGVTADDPGAFEYRSRRRPLYPLEPDAEYC